MGGVIFNTMAAILVLVLMQADFELPISTVVISGFFNANLWVVVTSLLPRDYLYEGEAKQTDGKWLIRTFRGDFDELFKLSRKK